MKTRYSLIFSALLSAISFGSWAGEHHQHPQHLPQSQVQISQAWARALPPNAPAGAAYLEITNHSDQTDRLQSVSSEIAERSELHESSHSDGLMKMQHIEAIELPAHATVSLQPGAKHIMLFGLQRPLAAGEQFTLTLDFAEAGKQEVLIEVLEQAPTGAVQETSQHHHH